MRRVIERTATAAALALVLWFYAWTVAAVGGLTPPARSMGDNDYYNHLVAGFLQGHLYMDLPVSPALQALPDPYDPTQNQPYRVTDASYFRGRYYLYFGAAPAVTLLLPFRLITGNYLPAPDAILVFCDIGFLAAAALWLSIRRRYFPDAPAWTAAVGVLLLGIGTTAPVLLRRPFFWELATAGGFAFSMLAAAALWRAIHKREHAPFWLAAAGVFLGLAVASRPTYVYVVPALVLPLFTATGIGRWKQRRNMAIAAATGIGAIGATVFAYNYARFGSGFEFGHNYLLSVAYESKVKLFALRHLLFNARMYFTLPGAWSWHSPYFAPIPVTRAEMPDGFYTVDDPFGLLRVFPMVLFALASPWALHRRPKAEARSLALGLAALALFFLAAGTVILLYVATIPRYAVDFLPALAVLTLVGMLAVLRREVSGRARPAIAVGVLTAACLSLVLGAASVCDVGHLLAMRRPDVLAKIDRLTTQGEALRDRLRGVHYGPVEWTVELGNAAGTETVLTAGIAAERDRIVSQRLSTDRLRFGVQHANAPVLWSSAVAGKAGESHRLSIELGSFYPPLEHAMFAGIGTKKASWIQHRAEIRYDGTSILRTFVPFVASRVGATRGLDPAFSGRLLATKTVEANLAKREEDGIENLVLEFPLSASAPSGRWPLLVCGRSPKQDALWIEKTAADEGRLAYRHGNGDIVHSASFRIADATHRLELRQTEYGWSMPADGDRLLVAWFDGALVWKQRVPAFRADVDEIKVGVNAAAIAECAAELPDLVRSTAPASSGTPGGPLLLRVMFPPGVKTAWRPLLALGEPGAADTLSVCYVGLDAPEVRLDHWGAPMLIGSALVVDPAVGHDVEIYLPTFAPGSFGRAADGDAWVVIDGRDALRRKMSGYGFSSETFSLGTNRVNAMMNDRYFRGAFVQQLWLTSLSPSH